ncbi:MAG TPA: hypothetical protein VFO34_03880 [Candidatus Acidoferrales bacterium]|nr:hypothetical protein [Candidatus Acidoferrales bacterium]
MIIDARFSWDTNRRAFAGSKLALADGQLQGKTLAAIVRIYVATLAIALLTVSSAGQISTPSLQGIWTASAGKSQVFRGSWTAAIDSRDPNSAHGYWTLRNDLHEVTLEGTWSARKTGMRWHGTWTARTQSGQSFSGTWDAAVTDAKLKTFADMLRATFEKTVAGFWQSGHLGGNWWLDGEKPKPAGP